MYTRTADTCVINEEYLDPEEFERVLDVFAFTDTSSREWVSVPCPLPSPHYLTCIHFSLVLSQFSTVNDTHIWYDAKALNNSAVEVAADIARPESDTRVTGPYLIATLYAFNNTANNTESGGSHDPQHVPAKPSQSTGLAMIVLYAITGCVSLLFIVVIASGAIRAIRHPDRYGPRAAGNADGEGGGAAQTRAAGLTRAILDTFPVIKYAVAPKRPNTPKPSADHASTDDLEMKVAAADRAVSSRQSVAASRRSSWDHEAALAMRYAAGPSSPRSSRDRSHSSGSTPTGRPTDTSTDAAAAVPAPAASVGHEVCPICIGDFVEGVDVRVLPCKGQHVFHRDCVDPWLLETSGTCPLCREGAFCSRRLRMCGALLAYQGN